MLDVFKNIFSILFSLLKYPLAVVFFIAICFTVSLIFNFVINFEKFKQRPASSLRSAPKISIIKRLFVLAPRQVINDMINRPPDFFRPCGLIIYEGSQGSGKTSTMVHDIISLQYQYPKVKVITNFALKSETNALRHWKQLLTYKNGYQGVIAAIDELQNWFNSKQSASFPPEMLGVVTQNRKNRRVIFGTAQNFYMLAKDIRTQCTELRKCKTFLGCITVVHRVRPICDSAGDVVEYQNIGRYFWVHTEAERESYDTYKVIESFAKSGFSDKPSNVSCNSTVVNVQNNFDNLKKRYLKK